MEAHPNDNDKGPKWNNGNTVGAINDTNHLLGKSGGCGIFPISFSHNGI